MDEARRSFGLLKAMQLGNVIRQDMIILSEAFEHFAPERKLALMGKNPELATTILGRLSMPAGDSQGFFLLVPKLNLRNQKEPSFAWGVSQDEGRNEMVRRTHPNGTLG
jgi:hypothetical protein